MTRWLPWGLDVLEQVLGYEGYIKLLVARFLWVLNFFLSHKLRFWRGCDVICHI